MPTCGTIVPLRRAQKCPLMSNDISRFRSHDFLFRSHKRQMRSEKLLCCRAHGVTNIYIYGSSFASFAPHALHQRSPARSGIENRWPKGKAKVKGRSS